MVAVYPAEGARYARHCDNPDRNGRKMTVILYLNPGWEQRMGGNLHIFRPLRSGLSQCRAYRAPSAG